MAEELVNGRGKGFSDIQSEINKSIDALDAELREINLKVFGPTTSMFRSMLTYPRFTKILS